MYSRFLVRDREVEGSNPFAPTTSPSDSSPTGRSSSSNPSLHRFTKMVNFDKYSQNKVDNIS
jgi:hypothetical protein